MKDRTFMTYHTDASKKPVSRWIARYNAGPGFKFFTPQESVAYGYDDARHLSTDRLKAKLFASIKSDKVPSYVDMGRLIELKNRGISIDNYVDSKGLDKFVRGLEDEANKLGQQSKREVAGNIAGFLGTLGLYRLFKTVAKKSQEDPKVVDDFVNKVLKHRKLDTEVTYVQDGMRSLFDQRNNIAQTVYNKAIAGHELGHADTYRKATRIFGKKLAPLLKTIQYATIGDFMPPMNRVLLGPISYIPAAGFIATPLAFPRVTKFLKGNNKESLRYKLVKKVEDNPATIGILAGSPKLLEEGKATAKSLHDLYRFAPKGKRLVEVGKGIKVLSPAFGTYALAASIPALALAGLRRNLELREKLKSERQAIIKKTN